MCIIIGQSALIIGAFGSPVRGCNRPSVVSLNDWPVGTRKAEYVTVSKAAQGATLLYVDVGA